MKGIPYRELYHHHDEQSLVWKGMTEYERNRIRSLHSKRHNLVNTRRTIVGSYP